MKKNLGSADRVIRVILALSVAALYFTDQISGTVGIILGLLAVVFLLTSALGFCPVYWGFKLSTLRKSSQQSN